MEICITRTNHFKVKDPNRLMAALAKLVTSDGDPIQIYTEHKNDGIEFVFGCESEIKGYAIENEETDIHPFLDELIDIVADGDAVILQEIRYDKLRYVAAFAYIITSTKWDCIDFSECVFRKACEVTGNQNYRTQLDY